MDTTVKKQRRRSIRNIRKSACFVPPTVEYGSAWVGENQETNISNLVKSFEDLQCQDAVGGDQCAGAGVHSQDMNRFKNFDEEAQDGFEVTQFSAAGKNMPSYDHSQITSQLRVGLHPPNCLNSSVLSSLSVANEPGACREQNGEAEGFTTAVTEQILPTGFHSDLPNNLTLCNRNKSSSLTNDEMIESINCSKGNSSSPQSSRYQGLTESIENLNLISSVLLKEESDVSLQQTEAQMPSDIANDNSVNNSCHNCYDDMKVKIIHNGGEHGENCQSMVKRDTDLHDSSMSPEYAEFDSYRASADSTPSRDALNQAMTLLLDESAGSLFNMSFSPMNVRPNTPTSSGFVSNDASQNKGTCSSSDQLRESISLILASLEDPVISSDPETSQIFQNLGKSSSACGSSALSPLSHDSCSVGGFNKTYTLPSLEIPTPERASETGNGMDVTISGGGPPSHLPCHGIDATKLVIVDFDFKKDKGNRRRSSKFLPLKRHSYSDSPTATSTDPAAVTEEENRLGYGSMDCGKTQSTPYRKDTICNADDVTIQELSNNLSSNSNVFRDDVTNVLERESQISDSEVMSCGDTSTSTQFSQSPPKSVLSDCSNEMVSNAGQVKAKKPRRKSNKLSRLIQESTRFLPQVSGQEMTDGLQSFSLNKENESMEESSQMQESDRTDQSKHGISHFVSRSLRKRPGRKSWDFRTDSQSSVESLMSVVKPEVNRKDSTDISDSEVELSSFELNDVQTIYGKQRYIAKSPQALQTVKESGNEKAAFSKRSVKRYLKFGMLTDAKEKKRMKKALNVYRGRQCYFPVTEEDFQRKMLDVQLLLDVDVECL